MTDCSGAELSEIIGKSKNTIVEWTRRGLPCERGKAGNAYTYHVPHVILWMGAKRLLETLGRPLMDSLPMMLLGDQMMNHTDSFAAWRPQASALAKELGFSDKDFDAALGELIQAGLLTNAWKKRPTN